VLDQLDDVPWKDLGHAYGSAEDIPALLHALAGSGAQQGEALYELFGNIWHQGTVYEASAYAVPFLVELAADPRVGRRDEILGLVAAIAKGKSYLAVHARLGSPVGERFRQQADFEQRLGRELADVEAAHLAVYQQHAVFTTLLADDLPMVRAAAVHVLSCFPEDVGEFGPIVVRATRQEQAALARAAMLWCIGFMRDGSSPATELLEETLHHSTDPRQVFAAATALHQLSGKRPESAEAICGCMKAARWFAESFLSGVPWEYSAELNLDDLFSGIEASPLLATQMLLRVLREPDVDAYALTLVVHDLLYINFIEGDWQRQGAWTALQRELIRALVTTDAAWLDTTHLWFLVPNGAKRLSQLVPSDLRAVRDEMSAALVRHGG
jgi:hypothetical protein